MTVTLHDDLCTFVTISCRIILRMRNFLEEICRENLNTLFILNNFFPPEKPAVCEMEKHRRVGQATDENIMWLNC